MDISDRSIYCIICTNRLLAGHTPLGHTDALAGRARERERDIWIWVDIDIVIDGCR